MTGETLRLVAGVGGFNSSEPVQHFEEAAVKCMDQSPHCLVTLTSSGISLSFCLCVCKMKFPLACLRGCGEDEGSKSTHSPQRRG